MDIGFCILVIKCLIFILDNYTDQEKMSAKNWEYYLELSQELEKAKNLIGFE